MIIILCIHRKPNPTFQNSNLNTGENDFEEQKTEYAGGQKNVTKTARNAPNTQYFRTYFND